MITAKEARERAESVIVERELLEYDAAIQEAANDGLFQTKVVGLAEGVLIEKLERELGYCVELSTFENPPHTIIRW